MIQNRENIYQMLSEKLKDVKKDVAMKDQTSFRVGGPVDLFIEPASVEELIAAIQILKEQHVKYYIIGNGSNLLVSDKGLEGAVIKLGEKLSKVEIKSTEVVAEAGALLSSVSKATARQGLTGMEFASGIPGAIGGAVTMNAGAYGGEMKDVVQWVEILDNNQQVQKLSNSEMQFGYRHSLVEAEGWIVLQCAMALKKGNQEEIDRTMADLASRRREKQPLHLASAGSTFKRPEGYFAAKLIEDSGLKGFSVGDAQVSPLHSGFVVNNGNATASEVYTLIRHVQKTVYEKFNVRLETEVKLLGQFE